MKLTAKSLIFKNTLKLELHPLAKKLSEILNKAYLKGEQEGYLKNISSNFECFMKLPINNLSVVFVSIDKYQIVGGCFLPFFTVNNLNDRNSLLIGYKSSYKNIKPIHKAKVQKEFEQDIINFIYLDFIRALSIISLSRPGAMYKDLAKITKNSRFKSDIWNELFEKDNSAYKKSFLLKDFALLIDKSRDTLIKQA